MKNIEIEIQVRVSDSDLLLEFLSKNAISKGEKYQKDEYFSPLHRDFLSVRPVIEWLRLRESKSNSINYKYWHHDENGKSHHCDEIETVVEDIKQVKKIFEAIDVKSIVMVEKTRKTWDYKDYEISVDSVTNLGDFVEIEYIGADSNVDPKTVTDEMIDFLKSVGIKKIERNYVGYPYSILFPDEDNFELV